MESGRSCPDCGSSNLVDDSLYSQSQLVCADCGSVVSEGLLTTTRSEEIQGTDVRYRESTALHKQPCYNQIQGLKRVRALCRILRFPRVIEETAESLFGQAYEHPSFLNVSLQKKEVLAGSCVLLSSRQHHWPIAMGTIYSLLEASEHTMGMVYNELVKILNVDAPPNHIKDLLESHCHQYKLSPSEVPEVFSESTARLVERAAELLELAATTWLVTGRHPVHVLAGVVYVAWLSLNPCKARLAVPLARFFKVAKVALPGQAALRVVELKEVLCRLGRELPWLRGTPVEPRTVPTLTADILKHRVLLMKKAMRSFDHELQEGPPAQPLASPEGPPAQPLASLEGPPAQPLASPEGPPAQPLACPEGPPAQPLTCPEGPPAQPLTCPDPAAGGPPAQPLACPEGPPAQPLACPDPVAGGHVQEEGEEVTLRSVTQMQASDWPSTEASRSSTECPQGQPSPSREASPTERTATSDPVPENNWAKRHLFVPPCTRNPPKKRRVEQVGPEVTGYEEISDSEIEGYLRTPQEMDEFAEQQRRLMSADH